MMDPVPVSALEHYCYCPRQAALIHIDGVWADNEHTVRGARGHRRADERFGRTERGRVVLRAVPIWSERLGLAGRADAVEILPDGSVVPVEYKMGVRHGEAAEVQLCAQALCLEEMLGRPVPYGYVWYAATRRRCRVVFDQALRDRTVEVIAAVHGLFSHNALPPAEDDGRCANCQLASHCLPHLVHDPSSVGAYLHTEVYGCDS